MLRRVVVVEHICESAQTIAYSILQQANWDTATHKSSWSSALFAGSSSSFAFKGTYKKDPQKGTILAHPTFLENNPT